MIHINKNSNKLIQAPFAKRAQYLKPNTEHYQEILRNTLDMMELVSNEFLPPSYEPTLDGVEMMAGVDETLQVFYFSVNYDFDTTEEGDEYIKTVATAIYRYLNHYEGEAGIDYVGHRWLSGSQKGDTLQFSVFFFFGG